jgi:hypothetical protein
MGRQKKSPAKLLRHGTTTDQGGVFFPVYVYK